MAEDRMVEVPRQCISALHGGGHAVRHSNDALPRSLHGPRAQRLLQLRAADAQQLPHAVQRRPRTQLQGRRGGGGAAAAAAAALAGGAGIPCGDLGALAVGGRHRELDVAQVQHRGQGSEHVTDLGGAEADGAHGRESRLEVLGIVALTQGLAAGAPQVVEGARREPREGSEVHVTGFRGPLASPGRRREARQQPWRRRVHRRGRTRGRTRGRQQAGGRAPRQHLVEDVKAPLAVQLVDDAHLLEEVSADPSAHEALRPRGVLGAELQLDVLAEARGVVVPQGLRVAEGLQQRIGPQHLTLHAR
mmetsp:Transcript_164920/g.529375  ORF Transcript_164920/g.529375 Transcript_164920/m.529375 type:complete len:304 (+) Transcript_164920:1233-2144(+)